MIKYKKILFLICVFFITKETCSQIDSISKWHWRLGTDFRQSFRTSHLPSTSTEIDRYHENLERKSPLHLGGGGVYLGRAVTKHVSIETGLVLYIMRYETGIDTLIDHPYKIATRFDYRYLTFPLLINYRIRIKPWLSLQPSMGFTVDLPLPGKELRKYLTSPFHSGYNSEASFEEYAELRGSLGSSIQFRFNFEFKFGLNSICVAPFYSYTYTNMYSFYTRSFDHYYSYGLALYFCNYL
jgi:hypothetical protein